jgi:arylformamidase
VALIDISPALSAALPMWPGDTPFRTERSWDMAQGSPVNVSKITLSTHAGAHADAPLHYAPDGAAIDEVSLGPYIGPCAVIHLFDTIGAIGADAILAAVERVVREPPPRILIRTYQRQPERWDPDFAAISDRAVHRLADAGLRLIGVDTPSLDLEQSKTMDAHRAILTRDIRVLEGLVLDAAPEGVYELIALPLKLKGLDAAPVRAVLRTLP